MFYCQKPLCFDTATSIFLTTSTFLSTHTIPPKSPDSLADPPIRDPPIGAIKILNNFLVSTRGLSAVYAENIYAKHSLENVGKTHIAILRALLIDFT